MEQEAFSSVESNLRTEPAGFFPFRVEGLLKNLGPYFLLQGLAESPGRGAVASYQFEELHYFSNQAPPSKYQKLNQNGQIGTACLKQPSSSLVAA